MTKISVESAREFFLSPSEGYKNKRLLLQATQQSDTASKADSGFTLDVTSEFIQFIEYAESLERKVEELEEKHD